MKKTILRSSILGLAVLIPLTTAGAANAAELIIPKDLPAAQSLDSINLTRAANGLIPFVSNTNGCSLIAEAKGSDSLDGRRGFIQHPSVVLRPTSDGSVLAGAYRDLGNGAGNLSVFRCEKQASVAEVISRLNELRGSSFAPLTQGNASGAEQLTVQLNADGSLPADAFEGNAAQLKDKAIISAGVTISGGAVTVYLNRSPLLVTEVTKSLTIKPEGGQITGNVVAVSGTSITYELSGGDRPVQTGPLALDAEGNFAISVPAGAKAGTYTLKITGSKYFTTSTIQVIDRSNPNYQPALRPNATVEGEWPSAQGSGFQGGDTVEVSLLGADGTVLATHSTVADAEGNLVAAFNTTPPAGTYTVVAVDGNGKRTSTSLEIIKKPVEPPVKPPVTPPVVPPINPPVTPVVPPGTGPTVTDTGVQPPSVEVTPVSANTNIQTREPGQGLLSALPNFTRDSPLPSLTPGDGGTAGTPELLKKNPPSDESNRSLPSNPKANDQKETLGVGPATDAWNLSSPWGWLGWLAGGAAALALGIAGWLVMAARRRNDDDLIIPEGPEQI